MAEETKLRRKMLGRETRAMHRNAVPMQSLRVGVRVLAAIGVLAVCLFALTMFDLSFKKRVKEEFGSPEAIAVLAGLYERAGKELNPVGGERELKIPHAWIPEPFSKEWRHFFEMDTNVVFASFDETGKLVAIEFQGSRYGCIISTRPELVPSRFGTAYRLATKPLYVTGVVAGDMY